jgi:hypothetical protein
VEALMHYCVVVQANGKELDYLRGEAYRVSRDEKLIGTLSQETFCFEDANVRTRFCAICVRPNIRANEVILVSVRKGTPWTGLRYVSPREVR